MLALIIAAVTLGAGYVYTRRFLRFVDAVQRPAAPIVAGAATALLAVPVVALLPVVGVGTAVAAGVGVAAGVASGRRDHASP
jgi:hypothetical protein